MSRSGLNINNKHAQISGQLLIASLFLCLYVLLEQHVFNDTSWAQDEKTGKQVTKDNSLPDTTNIHYSGKYCLECHEKIPRKGGDMFLRYKADYNELCRCHFKIPGKYTHPYDIVPSDDMKPRIPKTFPLINGRLTCPTCHDISIQCQEEIPGKVVLKPPKFLRGIMTKDRTRICFNCHEESKYEKFNPHKQIDEKGNVKYDVCLYCHVGKPDEKTSTYEELKFVGDMLMLCDRCHNKANQTTLHARHIRTPSPRIRMRIMKLEKVFAIILPLDNGKITCATCHNPHQKGLIPNKREASKGADEKFRNRIKENLCIMCHKMPYKIPNSSMEYRLN